MWLADSNAKHADELTGGFDAPDDITSWIVEVLMENVAELPVTAVEAVVRKVSLGVLLSQSARYRPA
ncbi:hypothetical protein Pmar_PMAR019552 [Perkinsus marinus ATCC 50983]|uniref:Uncharacterized protein n=1 Tax=Perkinsus marinus (strain ATCC 50983 / TXsc) TaxID=423536 RepID=C5KRC1_PERM5|nr:hypothetical protein Pmar_PMAR019552 [Perkinsus marinus ATCC 50983]EER13022.1 hypothetical protein Pmar_PMAR019552 [Perkinsus marinus ATCC 50983]|eukprot:XP_002781227.1 hypothetical protein Pmar_PMAR019552 [Perkinsus marinus ATCC 50983]